MLTMDYIIMATVVENFKKCILKSVTDVNMLNT